jgi:acetolactate synthase I/III small subunit
MLHTFIVYVDNKPGVLSRVVSLFRRRAFNIDSLTVGRTEKPDVSRMTIVVDTDTDQAKRIVANVYKLVNVLLVDDITAPDSLTIEITGTEEKIDRLLDVLQPLGLLEVVRTGQVAMRRGAKAGAIASKEDLATAVEDDSVSYSV